MTHFDQPIVTICEYGPGSHMNFVGANFALTKSITQIAAHPDRIKNSFVKIWAGLSNSVFGHQKLYIIAYAYSICRNSCLSFLFVVFCGSKQSLLLFATQTIHSSQAARMQLNLLVN
jgi:hypothetical protein